MVGKYPLKVIIIGGILGFILITTVFKNIKEKISKGDLHCNIKVIIDEKSIKTKAIIDTGNFLKEPITKTPVIVLEKNILTEIIPEKILNNLDKIIIGSELDIEEFSSRIRIIPFKSLGKENGILLGFKADKIIIEMEENTITTSNIIIGIYDGCLNKFGKYHGLVGMEIIDEINNNPYYEKL